MYDSGTAPSLWAQGENRFDPLLGGNRAPESGRIDNGQYVEVFSHRRHGGYPGTYAHIPSLVRQVGTRNGISLAQQQPATPSPPPLFYDYSEHFHQHNDSRAPVDQDFGQRQHGIKEGNGRIYDNPQRASPPDEHGFSGPIKYQSQGIISSSMTQADNNSLNKDILTAASREHTRFLPDKGSDLESDNESSDPASVGDTIALKNSMSDLGDADAAVSTPRLSRGHAADAVEVRIFKTQPASFVLFSTVGDTSYKPSLSTHWSYNSNITCNWGADFAFHYSALIQSLHD